MKKKSYGTVLISILLVGAVVGWMTFNSDTESQPAVEYRAVCRGLPANAHWTSGGTRKEIPSTESSPNVWTPTPVGTYDTSESDTECHFVCDGGYERKNEECKASSIIHDPGAGTITITDGITTYTIMDKNLGATIAGTGRLYNSNCSNDGNGGDCRSESIGGYFQRGNNYGFANSGTLATTSTKPNASGYGPGNPYSSGTFITAGSDWSSSPNDNLRGGSSSDGTGTIPTGQNAISRQGPCPDGWHVPSMGEWNQLLIARAGVNNVSLTDNGNGYYYFSNRTNATKFRNDFLLPLAGLRYYDSSASVYNQGSDSHYWSSSPTGSSARSLYLDTSYVYADSYDSRAIGFSVRCFKNS